MQIHCVDIRILPADLSGAEALLTPERRARMDRFRRPEDRLRALTGGLLLRAVLGSEAAASVRTGEYGKPFLTEGPCFNLSHAGDLVVLGVGDAELGIDVERTGRKLSDSVLRCLTPEERSWLEKVRPEDPTAFFRLWTAKESIMKATGLGLQLSPRSFHVLPVADGLHNILEQDWHLYWRSPAEDYILCAASRELAPPSLNFFSARELLL